jgi:hypothetical protein
LSPSIFIEGQTAYLATRSHGLALSMRRGSTTDRTQAADLPGDAFDVAIDCSDRSL